MNNEEELIMNGYSPVYDYTQYSHDNHINVIPRKDFKRLVCSTFKTLADILRNTYGPYGSSMMLSNDPETIITKDGYHIFETLKFGHQYKRIVYLAIRNICDRLNRNVGDGTTSCILLAEHMFDKFNKMEFSNAKESKILSILTTIENDIQNVSLFPNSNIKKLNRESFMNIIKLAANYDEELTSVLMNAFDPVFDDNGDLVSKRNVVVKSVTSKDIGMSTMYDYKHLPGNYQINAMISPEDRYEFGSWNDYRVIVYDHLFTEASWQKFYDAYDKKTQPKVLIIARNFNGMFLDYPYKRYKSDMNLVKQPINIRVASIKGNHLQDEIKDLCAMLHIEPITLETSKPIVIEDLPVVPIKMINGDCLCFDFNRDNIPTEYIQLLKDDMKVNTKVLNSFSEKNRYLDRISALSLNATNTNLIVTSSTVLETQLIADKIDDCVHIIESASKDGVVPNLFKYGYLRLKKITDYDVNDSLHKYSEDKELVEQIGEILCESVKELFGDVWELGKDVIKSDRMEEISNMIYMDETFNSFDIRTCKFVSMDQLPTSRQYDIEVIAAALAIVKYLITTPGLIFDAHLIKSAGDDYHYE